MNITFETIDNITNATLEGRLDTTNAAIFEKDIASFFQLETPNIILHCENFNFISSSGLRIFLTLQKYVISKRGKLVLRNVQPLIYEVFEMTGFTKIFTIEN